MAWFNKKEKSKEKPIEKSTVKTVVEKHQEARDQILINSSNVLNRLKLLSGFFYKCDQIKDIVDQTEFINDIFDKNKDLNYRKLEQFHYYYTENLILLLEKLKKQREDVLIILTEQLSRTESKLVQSDLIEVSSNRIKKWTSSVSDYLVAVYRHLCDAVKFPDSTITMPGMEQITQWYTLSDEECDQLTNLNEDVYTCSKCTIQRRLMGKLNKNVFNIEWKAELRSNWDQIHLFQIKGTSDWFLWIPSKQQFKLIESTVILHYIVPNRSSKVLKDQSKERLKEEIERIKTEISKCKTIDSLELDTTFSQYLTKIRDRELLTGMNEIDTDRKFLEDVLKLEQFKI